MPAAGVTLLLGSACFKVPPTKLGRWPLDSTLVNEWECTSVEAEASDKALVVVLKFDERQYYVEWKEGPKLYRYRAYPGQLKGVGILNVVELPESGGTPWMAARALLQGSGVLQVQVPAKRITDLEGADARLSAFRRDADRRDAWQDFARCVPHKK